MYKLNDSDILDIQEGRAQLVDVRSIDEFNSGHASYAINLPLDDLDTSRLDKTKSVFVYCASGGRSEMATRALSQQNFDAVNIGGYYEAIDAMGEA